MSFKSDLYTYLQADSGIASIAESRIYYANAAQDTKPPLLIYHRTADDPLHHMTAASGKARPTYQFDCYAFKAIDADTLGEAVITALDGYKGIMGSTQSQFLLQSKFDLLDSPDDGSQAGLHRVVLTFDIWRDRTVPTFS